MRWIPLAIAAIFCVASCSRVGDGPPSDSEQPTAKEMPTLDENTTPVANDDTVPIAVMEQLIHKCGRAKSGEDKSGEEGSHQFSIRNEGDGPLRIAVGPIGPRLFVKLPSDTVSPGQSSKINVSWSFPETTETRDWRSWATIYTNDPQNHTLKLEVLGRVE